MPDRSLHLRVADVGVCLDLDGVRMDPRAGPYRGFLTSGSDADVRLRIFEGAVTPRSSEPIFEMPGHWRIFRDVGRQRFELCDPMTGRPNRVAEVTSDLAEGAVTLGPEGRLDRRGRTVQERPDRRTLAAVLDPLLRILLVDRIGRLDGVMLHAAAFDVGGVGLVFAGPSGAGKSTLSHLFAEYRPDATVIGDEQIFLRNQAGVWTVHGTPWPGSGFAVSPGGVPLGRVYLIHHDDRNRAYRQSTSISFCELLAQAFLPRWDDEALAATLSRIGDLAEGRTEKLGFVNTLEVVEYILREVQALAPPRYARLPLCRARERGHREPG